MAKFTGDFILDVPTGFYTHTSIELPFDTHHRHCKALGQEEYLMSFHEKSEALNAAAKAGASQASADGGPRVDSIESSPSNPLVTRIERGKGDVMFRYLPSDQEPGGGTTDPKDEKEGEGGARKYCIGLGRVEMILQTSKPARNYVAVRPWIRFKDMKASFTQWGPNATRKFLDHDNADNSFLEDRIRLLDPRRSFEVNQRLREEALLEGVMLKPAVPQEAPQALLLPLLEIDLDDLICEANIITFDGKKIEFMNANSNIEVMSFYSQMMYNSKVSATNSSSQNPNNRANNQDTICCRCFLEQSDLVFFTEKVLSCVPTLHTCAHPPKKPGWFQRIDGNLEQLHEHWFLKHKLVTKICSLTAPATGNTHSQRDQSSSDAQHSSSSSSSSAAWKSYFSSSLSATIFSHGNPKPLEVVDAGGRAKVVSPSIEGEEAISLDRRRSSQPEKGPEFWSKYGDKDANRHHHSHQQSLNHNPWTVMATSPAKAKRLEDGGAVHVGERKDRPSKSRSVTPSEQQHPDSNVNKTIETCSTPVKINLGKKTATPVITDTLGTGVGTSSKSNLSLTATGSTSSLTLTEQQSEMNVLSHQHHLPFSHKPSSNPEVRQLQNQMAIIVANQRLHNRENYPQETPLRGGVLAAGKEQGSLLSEMVEFCDQTFMFQGANRK